MKKLILLFCLLFITGCGDNTEAPQTAAAATETENSADDPPSPQPIKNADGFVFMYNGNPVYMDENMADVINKIGEPRHEFEAPSCAFDGIDRIFSYPGVEIHTYPKDGMDYVHTVNYKDDSIGTPENIYLGSNLNEVLNAYGNEYTEELRLYRFSKGVTYLSFLVDENDMVLTITYGLVI